MGLVALQKEEQKMYWRTQWDGGRLQAKKKVLTGNPSSGTLILDFQPPERGENKLLLFKSHDLWYFVKAAKQQ